MLKILVLLAAMITLCDCSRHSVPYTESDVGKFVRAGMLRAEIIKRFGEPMFDEKNPRFEDGSTNVDEIIYYDLPIAAALAHNRDKDSDHRFTGFQVSLKDGRVLDWSPSR